MHQDRFVRTFGEIYYPHVKHRFLPMLHIGKVKTVPVNTDLPDEVRMGLGKILDFPHNLSIEFQIHQMRLRIGIYRNGFLEMPQSLCIERHTDSAFSPRSNGSLGPLSHRTGTIRIYLSEHQRLVTRIRNGILRRHRMLPFYLAETMHFGIGGKTGLSHGCTH